MRNLAKKILRFVLPILILLISIHGFAQEKPDGDQVSATKQDVPASAPNLADIIPKAAKLSGELAILKNRVEDVLDVSEIKKNYARIEENLKGPAAQLRQIQDSKRIRLK